MNDIEGNKIEVGDLILLAKMSTLHKVIVLGFTKKSIIVSCARGEGHWEKDNDNYKFKIDRYSQNAPILFRENSIIDKHNAKQYLYYLPDILILEKNAEIPENLRKLINK